MHQGKNKKNHSSHYCDAAKYYAVMQPNRPNGIRCKHEFQFIFYLFETAMGVMTQSTFLN